MPGPALLALTRPVFLPYALLAAFIIASVRRDGARINKRAAIAFLAVFALVMAPWIARNAMIHHALIVSSTEGGLNFLESNNPESFRGAGDWIPHYSLSLPQVKKLASEMPEAALDRAMVRMAFGNIQRQPSRFARVYLLRLRALWQPAPHLHGDLSPKHIAFLNLWWISLYLLALGAITKLQLWRQHEHRLVLMCLSGRVLLCRCFRLSCVIARRSNRSSFFMRLRVWICFGNGWRGGNLRNEKRQNSSFHRRLIECELRYNIGRRLTTWRSK